MTVSLHHDASLTPDEVAMALMNHDGDERRANDVVDRLLGFKRRLLTIITAPYWLFWFGVLLVSLLVESLSGDGEPVEEAYDIEG